MPPRPSRLALGALLLLAALAPAPAALPPAAPGFQPLLPEGACVAGFACLGFEVRCPGAQQPARGALAVAPAVGAGRGLVLLHSGGAGTGWWGASEPALGFFRELQAQGLALVQVRWVEGWLVAAPGEDAGPGALACRVATVVRWAHEVLYPALAPLGPQQAEGACGFCMTGNSGGASQTAYMLSHQGLEGLLDAVVPTAGPPHGDEAKGCLRDPGQAAYWYTGTTALHDAAYGFGANGPCARHDPAWEPRWRAESVATGGSDYRHPTRVHIVLGDRDTTVAPAHALDWAARLAASGQPQLTVEWVQGLGHGIAGSQAGLAALRAALLA